VEAMRLVRAGVVREITGGGAMRTKCLVLGVLASAIGVSLAVHAWAFPQFARQTKLACVTCHTSPAGGADLKAAGKAFKADMTKPPAADTAKAAEYVGVNKCKMCHLKEYKSWQETKHASALVNLRKADEKVSAEMAEKLKVELKGSPAQNDGCVGCHVTGFHLAGGYPAADSAKTAAVSNMTCEGCHGPGSLHASAPMAMKKSLINRKVSANMCMQCHTAVISPAFKFEDYAKRGVHAVAAAAPAK
jgi:Cytochrome c554 and c-prime